MALNAATIIEVRPGGSDTNGGGFRSGGSGTDWSKQDAAQYALTNGGATTGSATISTVSAATNMVNNLVYVAGGTGSITAGWYEIISAVAGVSITLDRSTGLVTGTGVTLNIGGGFATMTPALAIWVANNIIYVKGGTYTVTSALTVTSVNSLPNTVPNRIIGYTTTRGDGGQATITTATNALTLMTCACENLTIENLIFDCASTTTSTGFAQTSGNATRGFMMVNCIAKNFTVKGFNYTAGIFIKCYATGGTTAATGAFACTNGNALHYGCQARNNSCHGFIFTQGNVYVNCIAASNKTSGTYNGFTSNGLDALTSVSFLSCISYDNSSNGILFNGTYQGANILNCIFALNGAYGINATGSHNGAGSLTIDYNAFYLNTSNPRNNFVAGPHDVLLSGDPFTSGSTGNFSLNNTAGAGAAARAVGYLGTFPDGLTAGYVDIGAVQHQDSGGGGQTSYVY